MRDSGPFDLIGDVHGCYVELEVLLNKLGYVVCEQLPGQALASGPVYRHPEGRLAVFLGDLVDRGPRILDTVRLVYNMVFRGAALCVCGNHDDKLLRKLKGRNVTIAHGLEMSLAEIDALPQPVKRPFIRDLTAFLETLPYHYILDNGRLVIAHAGLKEEFHGKHSKASRAFALYGEVTGVRDSYNLPVRGDWPSRYQGEAWVVYGHVPVQKPAWKNRTVGIDTGCVFGGKLTALRYPEMETVSVPARQVYYESLRPFPRASQR